MVKKYSVVIVQKSRSDKITTTHIQAYGRSEYEAFGYAVKHRIFQIDGTIVFMNAFDCDKKPSIDNWETITAEEKDQTN